MKRYRLCVLSRNDKTPNICVCQLVQIRAMKAVKYVEQDGVVRMQAVASWGLDRIDQRHLPLDGTADFLGRRMIICIYLSTTMHCHHRYHFHHLRRHRRTAYGAGGGGGGVLPYRIFHVAIFGQSIR